MNKKLGTPATCVSKSIYVTTLSSALIVVSSLKIQNVAISYFNQLISGSSKSKALLSKTPSAIYLLKS